MYMKKKSILLAATAVMLVAAMSIGGMLAYFTDTDTKTNTFTLGNVEIELTEPSWTEDSYIANPGVDVAKDPIITNVGENAAYVRMKVVVSDASAWIAGLEDKYPADPVIDMIFGGTFGDNGNDVNTTE